MAAICESPGATVNDRINALAGAVLVHSPGRIGLGIVGITRLVGVGTWNPVGKKTAVGGSVILSCFILDRAAFLMGGSQCTAELAFHVPPDPVVVWIGVFCTAIKTRPKLFS